LKDDMPLPREIADEKRLLLECGGLPPLSTANSPPSTPPPRQSPEPSTDVPQSKPAWPHAPTHRLAQSGTYMVTAGTYGKEHFFTDGPLLRMLHQALLQPLFFRRLV
jgi:hypothetical protein